MKKILILSICIPLLLFIAVAVPWLLIYGGIWLTPDPPKPQITQGEFPFEVVYTLKGETVTVSDVYVCEYAGIGVDEGRGKYLEWKGYLKSSGQTELVLLTRENMKIVCDIGSAAYYMKDPEYHETYDVSEMKPELLVYEFYQEAVSSHWLTDEEKKEYGMDLVSWNLSPPIENTFE